MKISVEHLRQYVPHLPRTVLEVRALFDDLGLEVKRISDSAVGPVFTLELLANRGDHHCYAGLALEVVGRLGGKVVLPEVAKVELGASPVPLRIASGGLRYAATLLEVPEQVPALPAALLAPLVAADIQSQNAIIDATNLVSLELGQPTHAFDADKISGGITVRLSRAGERAHPLFQEKPIELPEGTLVVADEVKILAVAGVIGCDDSKVTAKTRRVLLESATFDPILVRKGSRKLALQTTASQRFERGGDPAAVLTGTGRLLQLLSKHARAKVVGTTGMVGEWADPQRKIELDVAAARRFYAAGWSPEEAAERLGRYGFHVDRAGERLTVQVPPHRLWDIAEAADLYEELGRSYGYDSLPSALPDAGMGVLPTAGEQVRQRAEEVLTAQGFYEVFTLSFYDRTTRERLQLREGHPLWAHVEIENAQDRAFQFLKNNALAHALEGLAQNLNYGFDQVRMYEWTRNFSREKDEAGSWRERKVLSLLANGTARAPSWADKPPPFDLYVLKGLLRELSVELGIELEPAPADASAPLFSCLHPERQATVVQGGRRVGIFGQVHPAVVKGFDIKRARPWYLELEESALLAPARRAAFVPPPARPPLVRNLAFTLVGRVQAAEVSEEIRRAGPPWLERVSIEDLFAHEQDGHPARTVTYRLDYTNEGARTADEVNATSEQIVRAVEAKLAPHGVKLRR